ncbi:MAG: GNAT family N-acetyltransferase [Planctomycetota bacterium]|nr:GNAT family N-acetyltransferase [Planctomycetota bacterium]
MRGPATLTDELTDPRGVLRERHDGYTLVRTPECPTFHCGNGLVLHDWTDEPEAWVECCGAHLPDIAQIHIEYETDAVLAREASVNCLGPLRALARPAPVDVRLLAAGDWATMAELAHAIVEERYPGSRPYTDWRTANHQIACDEGRARWWGAFDGDQLVGSAGLYEDASWARFQTVLTRESHRGRGVCSTLIHAMVTEVASRRSGDEVILVAEAGSQAERIYRSVGFRPVGTQGEYSRPRGKADGR